VLDPCCGTGAYLVEVLRRIRETLQERGEDALAGEELKQAAMNRVFGFEILPAPFVVAHLQLGLLLQSLDAPLSETGAERVGVYLTNALTGWEPAKEPKTRLLFAEMEEERDRAEEVKRDRRILVVIGNPPYNGFAGVAVKEERELTGAYRTTVNAPPPQGQGLNDLYIRFFRAAERRIVDKTGAGVVCFISNYSWLDGLSFTGMRERYLDAFDHIWIDSLNGDAYKTGKVTPEGKPDPSAFSTEFNREGIQVGTAIATLLRKDQHAASNTVQFRHFWGKEKRAELLASIDDESRPYAEVKPLAPLGLPFVPILSGEHYGEWPLLPDLFPVSFPGVKTSRDEMVTHIDKARLVRRMEQYFDPQINDDEMRSIAPSAMQSTQRFNATETRDKLRKRGLLPENIVRYCYRPFDMRWIYWEPLTKLLDEKRSDYFPHVFNGNIWIEARQKQVKEKFDRGFVVKELADNFGNGLSNFFPLYLRPEHIQATLLETVSNNSERINLSDSATFYINTLGITETDLFHHVISILHAPTFRIENVGALRQDWARVPLPQDADALRASAALGRQIAAILAYDAGDATHAHAPGLRGITSTPLRPELKIIGVVSRTGGGQLRAGDGELALDANWGFASGKGVMPGKGKTIERDYTPDERAALAEGASLSRLDAAEITACLGERTLDVYLNDAAYWKNVPARVWNYHIGGYQVVKKWLSYRERAVLGRDLTPAEANEVRDMTRRIAALLLLEPALDANYQTAKAAAYAWPS
jgi:predicted helicase